MNRRRAMMRRGAVADPVFVGEYDRSLDGQTSNKSFPLTSLSGGIASTPAAGDLIMVFYGGQSIGPTDSIGYTTFAVDGVNNTYDAHLEVAYKIADGTETEVEFPTGTGSTSHSAAVAIQVWRGVDQVTPVDSYAHAPGTYAVPNPPAMTVGVGQFIMAGGTNCGNAQTGYSFTSTDPFVPFTSAATVDDGRESACALGTIFPDTGVFDPAQFGWSGSDQSSHSNVGITMLINKG